MILIYEDNSKDIDVCKQKMTKKQLHFGKICI